MKTVVYSGKILLLTILLFGLIAPLNLDLAQAKGKQSTNYRRVITNLESLLNATPDFKNVIEEVLRSQDGKSYYWDKKDITYFVNFFKEWLVYNPPPWDGPKYIQPFDELANSEGGAILFNNNIFSSWFIDFLDARGEYLSTEKSLEGGILEDWNSFPAVQMDTFKPPYGQKKYRSFIDIFLRVPKKPYTFADGDDVMVSPASGKIHQIYTKDLNSNFKVKRDVINIRQALNNSPIANKFIGGKIVDILLWFTDYHYFHAPIGGEIVEIGEYAGSYNYNFQDVNWYKELAKHKRTCYIIKSEKFGYVTMIPVGFWGVGSIITKVKAGDIIKKGDLLGRFGYGGSSILLIFEPNKIEFTIDGIATDWELVKPGTRIGIAPNN